MGLSLYAYQLPEEQKQLARRYLNLDIKYTESALTADFVKQIDAGLIYDSKGFAYCAQGNLLRPDWRKMAGRVTQAGRKNEALLKALKLSPGMRVLDTTAGLGIDSILIAGRQVQVTMVERHPVLALLLNQSLNQIKALDHWRTVTQNLSLHYGPAEQYLVNNHEPIDVVYCDPMFDQGVFKAQVKGDMQLLHSLSAPPGELEQRNLLSLACQSASKVVVKRAIHAPHLGNVTPDAISQGKSVRYDIYTNCSHDLAGILS